uniref:ATP synthase complex subunit 8 n=1 Tax=Lasiopodomys brandtii TaxID=407171 RepID=A0A6M3W3P9_9RODE|nr:ATP synthase F0 subunit 8 [Lasiopodomys brandtii]QJF47674.1 ATP synthase F0 subunit 8 [Lasiopodomys brandtii]QRV60496.1 ATP synthase F0 subunit 8 [Lasiopodomys brandtii]QRV60509.1 ATP synthase F0 subunit 8 [Lasiopodomys brandtii]QRV60522.1 ATP synthase F0 subunit 8 [Lasiopodomys brandtii]QYK91879.1 ATP synthase F0 subunit 8 [Lasiopodomys brandtii]
MPQLDTSTWFITILSTTITLFILMQLKTSLHNFPQTPSIKSVESTKTDKPWESKWTKIYSPLSLPQQ